MSLKAFEDDGLLGIEITRLVKEFNICSAIETGTEYGGTALALSHCFAKATQCGHVVTIDIEKKFIDGDLPPNVTFILGDSRFVLPSAIAQCRSPILFYLDAHSQDFDEECPLSEELAQIAAQSLKNPPIIVVHDCFVPGHHELGYATYKGIPISFDAIHTQIVSIYGAPSYFHHYNSLANGAKRGVLFITPQEPSNSLSPSREDFALPRN